MKLLTRIAERITWHRRGIAAILAALSMVCLVAYLKEPPPDLVAVAMTTRELPAGHTIRAEDVRINSLPAGAIPQGASKTLDAVVGQTTATHLGSNTVVQRHLLLTNHHPSAGRAAVPIVLRESGIKDLLRPGSVITLVLTGGEKPTVLTDQAVVVASPPTPEPQGFSPTAGEKSLLLVEVPQSVAHSVAALGQQGSLSVILGGTAPSRDSGG